MVGLPEHEGLSEPTKGATMENENREPTEDAEATEDLEVREDDAREIVGGVVSRKGGEGQIEDSQRP